MALADRNAFLQTEIQHPVRSCYVPGPRRCSRLSGFSSGTSTCTITAAHSFLFLYCMGLLGESIELRIYPKRLGASPSLSLRRVVQAGMPLPSPVLAVFMDDLVQGTEYRVRLLPSGTGNRWNWSSSVTFFFNLFSLILYLIPH
ncbi:hypothetical protein L209DRAFT_758919 [Thermothelomyces heterothallicus CBS 203.75]